MNTPKYLYHYTTIETLELIIKNKNIRFGSLLNVDDLEEVKSADLEKVGSYCFVSCWTDNEVESIPLWDMYTNKMKGVRLKMPVDMFEKYMVNGPYVDKEYESYFKYNEIFRTDGMIHPKYNEILEKIIYTDDEELLNPKVINLEENKLEINLNKVGKYKNTHWTFQNEWRYIIRILPITLHEIQTQDYRSVIQRLNKGECLNGDCYFLDIKEQAFEQMEILLGPNINDKDRITVESLVATYNPNAKIMTSNLKNKVKAK